MLGRRGFLRAAVWQGLAGASMAQQPKRKNAGVRKKSPEGRPDEAEGEVAIKADPRVAEILAPIRDDHHLPGIIGGILAGNRMAAIGAIGLRKIGSKAPILVTDQVHIGSCTKAMTATLAGMMVEEGKLSWGSTIGEVFPDLIANVHPDFRAVTLAQLLTHRAGLPPDVPWWRLPGDTPAEQRLGILTDYLDHPPSHRPGSNYSYSNVGFALVGAMIERVSRSRWEDLMRARLFGPLGMTSAGFGCPGTWGKVDQPWGHHESRGRIEPTQADNAPSAGPAGTVHCTIPDWSRFAALHMAAERGRPRLLKAGTFRVLHTPEPGFDYAGGWAVVQRTWAGGRAFNHNGSNTAWYVRIWLAPVINRAFLVAINQGNKVAEDASDQAIVALVRAHDYLVRG